MLGVFPLVIAHRAGAGMRQTLGTAALNRLLSMFLCNRPGGSGV